MFLKKDFMVEGNEIQNIKTFKKKKEGKTTNGEIRKMGQIFSNLFVFLFIVVYKQ